MTEHYFFYIGLAFILIHEMDAIRLQEWKMLPILSGLKEQTGYLIFESGIKTPVRVDLLKKCGYK